MKLAGTVFPALGAYDGTAYEIFISGCDSRCLNCHNPEMQDYEFGEDFPIDEIIRDIRSKREWIDWISFLGGEPLAQEGYQFMTTVVALKAKFPDKKFMLFTGKNKCDIPLWCYSMFDAIKYGPYVNALRTGGFPASSNQQVIRKGQEGWEN
jgi:anaerobic ribonucleoside-triphosphate reductase activating protein